MTLSIEEISDRLEIQDIYTRYVHAADDRESLDDIFLPNTTFDWTSAGGGKMTYEEAKAGPVFTGKLIPWSFHIYTNARINFLEDRQKAVVKVKAVNPSGLENTRGEPLMFQTHGTYTDQLEKTVDGWRITHRIWHEFTIVGPFKKADGIPGILESAGKTFDTYITVNPNNPANVITTQIPVTLPYTPCHCDHQIHPTVDMTTIGAPCRACGPNGEHSVTLTMPTAACEGGSEGFGDSYRPPYSPHRVEDHKILSDVRPYLKPQSTMAQQGEPSPMKGYVAVNGIRFMKDPMSSQPLVTDQRFTHPTHLPSITS
ncbi:hypothetical protein FOXYS1_767 [Fusarium oxysporum]|uniref:SnoaL-like domain-containing protein n=1 Tax=Fusarium oxysporum TaxID=5507 RepID=A0A8H5AQX9_FUSOX|nr:hypothetical protein FOXYS1_767 [Fusarium oxysporum]